VKKIKSNNPEGVACPEVIHASGSCAKCLEFLENNQPAGGNSEKKQCEKEGWLSEVCHWKSCVVTSF